MIVNRYCPLKQWYTDIFLIYAWKVQNMHLKPRRAYFHVQTNKKKYSNKATTSLWQRLFVLNINLQKILVLNNVCTMLLFFKTHRSRQNLELCSFNFILILQATILTVPHFYLQQILRKFYTTCFRHKQDDECHYETHCGKYSSWSPRNFFGLKESSIHQMLFVLLFSINFVRQSA